MAKYWWGSDDVFPMPLLMVAIFAGGMVMGATVSATTPSGPAIATGASLASVKMTVIATVCYYFVYYQAIGAQVNVKMALGNRTEAAAHVAERTVVNTLEQMPLFLLLMWLFTLYCDANVGGALSLLYAAYTQLYQFAYASYGHFTINCEFCTQPRYAILTAWALELLFAANGASYLALLPANALLLGIAFSVQELLWQLFGWALPFALPVAILNNRANLPPPNLPAAAKDATKGE